MSNNGSNAGHASLIDVEESSSAVNSGPSADGKPSAGGKSQKKSPKQMTGRKYTRSPRFDEAVAGLSNRLSD
jgi:hypothetical protein